METPSGAGERGRRWRRGTAEVNTLGVSMEMLGVRGVFRPMSAARLGLVLQGFFAATL